MFAFLFGSEQPGIVPQKALLLKMANAEHKTSRGKSQQYELRPGFGHKLTPVFTLSIRQSAQARNGSLGCSIPQLWRRYLQHEMPDGAVRMPQGE